MQEWKIFLKENYKLIVLVAIVFCLPFLIYLGSFYDTDFVKDADKWGVFGDFIGGVLNPLLGFVSVMTLLYTVRLQLDSIKIQKEELAATREELKRSAQAQEQSKFALEEQSKVFKRQQFDSVWWEITKLLIQQNAQLLEMREREQPPLLQKKIKGKQYNNLSNIVGNIRVSFSLMETNNEKPQELFINDDLIEKFQADIMETGFGFAQLASLIYRSLQMVETHFKEKDSSEVNSYYERLYVDIILSCLDDMVIKLLLICVYKNNDFSDFKRLLEKYSFFQNISFTLTTKEPKLEVIQYIAKQKYFSDSAFGGNINYQSLYEEEKR